MHDVIHAADECRRRHDDALAVISSKLTEFQDTRDRLGRWQVDNMPHRDEILQHIGTSADQLRSLVDRKQKQLQEDVDKLFTERRQHADDLRTAIEVHLHELQTLFFRSVIEF